MYITEYEEMFEIAIKGTVFEGDIVQWNEDTEAKYQYYLNRLRNDDRLEELVKNEVFTCKNDDDIEKLEDEYGFTFIWIEDDEWEEN